jgi:hypothetical protein
MRIKQHIYNFTDCSFTQFEVWYFWQLNSSFRHKNDKLILKQNNDWFKRFVSMNYPVYKT